MYKILSAQKSDLKEITRIYNASIAEKNATARLTPVSLCEREAWFEAHEEASRPIYALKRLNDGKILAWGSLSDFNPKEAYRITAEISIYVAPEARGKGLGGRLVNFMLERAPEFGVKNVVALIFSSNSASLNLFAKFGFTRWGELPEVCDMDGKPESLTILSKNLSSAAK